MFRKGSRHPGEKENKQMTISVTKVADDLYTANATPPEVEEQWSTVEPMHGRELTRELTERGAHQTDIGDAMYRQDPLWIEKLRGPYVPPAHSRHSKQA